MIRTVLSLRRTVTLHQLRRERWRMLVLIGGAIWSISLFPSAVWASRILGFNAVDLKYDALVAIVAVVMIGWVVVPILITGLDDTLDPGRFASLGVSAKRLMPGLTVSALLTVPAIFFLIVLVILAFAWQPEGRGAFAFAITGAILTLLTCVFSARVSVMWASRVLQSRRSREATFLTIIIGALLITPAIYLVVADGLEIVLDYDIRLLVDLMGGTPVGAPIQAAVDASKGAWVAASWHLAVSGGWIVLLHFVWRVNVERVLVNPIYRGGGAREREDTVLAAAERAERSGLVPPGARATNAMKARALRYWFTDPRYLSGIISVTVFPILFFMLVYPIFGSPAAVVMAVPVVLAGSIGWGRHNDVAMDNSALWLDIVSGSLGQRLMRGRVAGTLTWAVPLAAAAITVAVVVSGRLDLLPAIVGAVVGVLGTSLGVSVVTSVSMPYRAPAPGENPFGAEVGSIGAGLLAQFVSSLASSIVAVPVSLPLLAAVRWDANWGWAGLVVGSATGIIVLMVGARWAGTLYDRRSGRLVGAVS